MFGRSLLAMIGGVLAVMAAPLYAGTSLVTLAEDNVVNAMALLIVLAFFSLTVYEDWKDAKQARQKSRRD